jgi:hypothetical protein
MQVDSTTYAPRVEVDLAGLAPAEFTEHIRERITNLDHHAPDPILRATVGFSTPTDTWSSHARRRTSAGPS